MRSNLLNSKIQKPLISSDFIFRKHLVERLNDSQKKLLVLHATVGYGKTVVLAHYARQSQQYCAWYHLNDTDNDTAVFMQYLSASLEKSVDRFGFDPDAYASLRHEGESVQVMARDFIAQLEEALAASGKGVVVILDNFQVIENEEIHQIIQMILDNTSARVRLILATRGSAPPFYSRYSLQGAAGMVEQKDLCFTEDDVQALLARFLPSHDHGGLARVICEKAEGWPAGVMFASLYLKKKHYRSAETGLDEFYTRSAVNTYFMHEIFKKLPYGIQTFLTQTSALEFLSSEVCNTVLQIENAQSIFAYLERENLFITKVGQSDRVFRYHALFKEFLATQLCAESRREILSRAAEFHLHAPNKEQVLK